uniref:Sulfatase N-terminal domain-containing protein n=1 Tax=Rhodosorus marinus TaxID=101924 RepID=A0A7S3A3H2_9RHOD|mmetsp:Transcript_41081/g.162383  ORF Transcript_41081/g.162383 Transcript_41081/m.162383 type:complete len:559 (+) Transcript_41081:59-1735(+)
MRSVGIWLGLWVALVGLGECQGEKPNVIVILVDDLGYADLGVQGSDVVKSPHIDKLARDGVILTDGYAPHNFCGPSRSGLFTGIWPYRIGAQFNAPKDYWDNLVGLPLGYKSIPEMMREAGYQTYCVGKWHLGHTPGNNPKNRGFNGFFGFLKGSWNYKQSVMYDTALRDYDYVYRGFTRVGDINYITENFTDATIGYIARAHRLEKPFFIYLSYNSPHAPIISLKEDLDPDVPEDRRKYVGMIKSLDRGVEKIRNYLEKIGIAENTVIMFSSDNGGHRHGASNEPLRDMKGSYYEGGLRVPWYITWPGMLEPGQTFTKLATHLDIYPTLENLAQVPERKKNPDLVGVDLMPHFLKVGQSAPEASGATHSFIYFGGPLPSGKSSGMIRTGRWKLVIKDENDNSKNELYDLRADLSETTDLTEEKPGRAKRMMNSWTEWNRDNILPLYGRTRAPNPLRLELSVVGGQAVTTPGVPISFEATGSSVEGDTVTYFWETFIPVRWDEATFRDVWTDGVTSTSRTEDSISITYSSPGDYTVRVTIQTERWQLWEDVQVLVEPE